jgi:hypothetical protein
MGLHAHLNDKTLKISILTVINHLTSNVKHSWKVSSIVHHPMLKVHGKFYLIVHLPASNIREKKYMYLYNMILNTLQFEHLEYLVNAFLFLNCNDNLLSILWVSGL